MTTLQQRLDSFTWKNNSAVQALQPELEEWLWFCENAIATHWCIAASELEQWVQQRATSLQRSPQDLKQADPKRLFEHVIRERLKRTISPRDFEDIGRLAGVDNLAVCPSFKPSCRSCESGFRQHEHRQRRLKQCDEGEISPPPPRA